MMSQILLVSVGIMLLLVLIVMLLRRARSNNNTLIKGRDQSQASARGTTTVWEPVTDQFSGLRLDLGPAPCPAAMAVGQDVFPVKDAPVIPLEGCNSPRCGCKYVKSVGRRQRQRRVDGNRRVELRFDLERVTDRRASSERRKDVGRTEN